MAQMTGADIGDLERGAGSLESIGGRIGGMARPLRSQLYSSHWHGGAAERFRSEWDSVHGPALVQAEDFLRNAGQQLRREADEQRRASGAGGGGHGASSAGGATSGGTTSEEPTNGTLDEIRAVLETLGLPLDKIDHLLSRLRLLNELEMLSGPLKALAENEALKGALSIAGSALDYATLVVDFLTTVADNAHLPMDEAVVLAGATMAVGLAVGAGVKVAAKAIGGVVAGAFTGGAATVVGVVVGEVAGTVLHEAFDAADQQFDITENVAEQTLDAYRFAKERDFDPVRIGIDGAREGVEDLIEGGQNLAEGVVGYLNPFD